MTDRWLIDSNVLLRFVKPDDREYPMVYAAVAKLWTAGADLLYSIQNAAEFWNTCTRPPGGNGYGLTVAETDRRLRLIEGHFHLLEENPSVVYREWRRLIALYNVSGVQVHDARLAAAMLAHGIPHILTSNASDFNRFPGIAAVHPKDVS